MVVNVEDCKEVLAEFSMVHWARVTECNRISIIETNWDGCGSDYQKVRIIKDVGFRVWKWKINIKVLTSTKRILKGWHFRVKKYFTLTTKIIIHKESILHIIDYCITFLNAKTKFNFGGEVTSLTALFVTVPMKK